LKYYGTKHWYIKYKGLTLGKVKEITELNSYYIECSQSLAVQSNPQFAGNQHLVPFNGFVLTLLKAEPPLDNDYDYFYISGYEIFECPNNRYPTSPTHVLKMSLLCTVVREKPH